MFGQKTLLVAGGSGFVGSHVIRIALKHNWKVISLQRGVTIADGLKPSENLVVINHDLASKDDLSSDKKDQLKDVNCILHSVGSLLPWPEYKTLFKGTRFNSAAAANIASQSKGDITYSTAEKLLSWTKDMYQLEKFSFLSASEMLLPFPFNLAVTDYFKDKRRVEDLLKENQFSIKSSTVYKPGLIYAENQGITMPLSTVFQTMACVKKQLPYSLRSVLPPSVAKPIHVDVLAQKIFDDFYFGSTNNSENFRVVYPS